MYEYGSRAGVWRILELFASRGLPLTAFAVGRALELTPEIGHALRDAGHEVAGHGYRWLDYRDIPEDTEREHIQRARRPSRAFSIMCRVTTRCGSAAGRRLPGTG